MLGALPRKVLLLCSTVVGCVVLLLFASGWVGAGQVVASWYGPGLEGATTASGEPFNPNDYTAAHRTLPFETRLIVTYGERSVVVRVNDRGPYVAGRDLDLSQAAAQYLGLTSVGEATVGVAVADPSVPTGPYGPEAASPETASPRASRADRA
jgi:rare lipoprotein A